MAEKKETIKVKSTMTAPDTVVWEIQGKRNIYKDALLIQDAVNLSGIVHAWADILSGMVKAGLDTEQIWHHPVNVLFASKVADLTASEAGLTYAVAYDQCKKEAEK